MLKICLLLYSSCRWINVGSCKRDVAATLQRIFLKCFQMKVDLRVTWVPRSHSLLVEADALSRRDTDEYALRNRDFYYIREQYGADFSLDVFASRFLHRASKYYSKHPSIGSAGTDGLYQPWSGEDAWVFPPRKLIGAVIRRLEVEESFRGALVGLDNAEGLIKMMLFPEGHAPSYVWQVYKYPIKIRMGYSDAHSDSMRNTFSDNWHDVVVLFVDKEFNQTYMPARCFKKKGECRTCGGNDYVTDVKINY